MQLINSYALALYEIAKEQNLVKDYLASFKQVLDQGKPLDQSPKEFKNFYHLVKKDFKFDCFKDIFRSFYDLVQRDSQKLTIFSAVKISSKDAEEIIKKAKDFFKANFTEFEFKVDKYLLAGFILAYKDRRIDCSYKRLLRI